MALIARELTPSGKGAVSVLEVIGPAALETVQRLSGAGTFRPGDLRVLRLSDRGEDLDEALCLALDAEHVELHLHGSPILIERVTRALEGGPPSRPERACIEQLARALLTRARGEVAARILLDQAEGALTRRLEEVACLDETAARTALGALLKRSIALTPALLPPRVILAGPPNTGKSTLFNALVGSERAITSDVPGTTRDTVIGYANFGGLEYEFIDTAGMREVAGEGGEEGVEREGQRAAEALRESAEVVFWLERAGESGGEVPAGCELLETHADRLPNPPRTAVSALQDPLGARERLAERLASSILKWIPGEAVLFTQELRAWVEGLLSDPTGDLRARLLEGKEGEVPQ